MMREIYRMSRIRTVRACSVVLVAALFLAGCVTTGASGGLEKQGAVYAVESDRGATDIASCLAPEMETVDLLIGFGWEDLTVPVRKKKNEADELTLVQKSSGLHGVLTMIRFTGGDTSETRAELYVSDSFTKARRAEIVRQYSGFMDECR